MSEFVVGSELAEYADIKMHQLQVASDIGFRIPDTLATNDSLLAREFLADAARLVIKPFAVFTWWEAESRQCRIASTTLAEAGTFEFDDAALAVCPCILQRYVPKKFELRVTVIGSEVFVAKLFHRGGGSFTDWRYAVGSDQFGVSEYILDDGLRSLILRYMRALGLNFGCLDLIVDPDGEVWFLEVNPAGQFLFVEEWLPGLTLLSAFASLLCTAGGKHAGSQWPEISVSAFIESRRRAG